MLSPSAAVGEMVPWATPSTQPVFQMPQVTYQNSHSPTNGDWGNQGCYRESQHHKARPQPQWAAHKRRQQNYRESKYGPDTTLPVPPPPAWQPPAAVPNSGAFQEPQGQGQGPMAVNLQDLPQALCRQNFLEAMMEQAGLTGNILSCILGQGPDTGKALIYLTDHNAAQRCAAHFHGCSWSNNGGSPVKAQVVDVPIPIGSTHRAPQATDYGSSGLDKAPGGKTRKAPGGRSGKITNAPWKTPELPYAAVSQPGWDGFAEIGYSKQDSDDLYVSTSTDAGGSSRASWDTTTSSFCYDAACDTDDGF